MNVHALKLYDAEIDNWHGVIEDHYEYTDFKADNILRTEWISFDGVLYDSESDRVYLGITSFDADIFRAYDRASGEFTDLGFSSIADPFDAKFHRSLVKTSDGLIYGAIALLHDVDNYNDAPGGAIVRYDPKTGNIGKIGIPQPHVYIQGMVIDEDRRIAYCQTFTPEYLVAFNLDTHESDILGLTGSGFGMGQGENIVLDSKGCVWGGWSVTRAWQSNAGVDQYRLYRYDPERDAIEFFRHGLPHLDKRYGFAHLDGMFAAPNGNIYCGSGEGGLFRIDPDSAVVTPLGAPVPPARIAAFAMGPDGYLYGIGGRYGNTSLFRMDLDSERYELIGHLYDPEINEAAWQIHDMDITPDGVIYAGENDNPFRSSYLWEITF